MAAVPDRLSRTIPLNPLKPFDGDGFTDLVAPSRRPPAHPALLNRVNHPVTQVLRIQVKTVVLGDA